MAIKDYIQPIVKIHSTLSFDLRELYKTMRIWLSDRGYVIFEKRYDESPTPEGLKKTSFFWVCEKKMDPYSKIVMEIKFVAETKDVVMETEEKEVLQEGSVDVDFGGYILKDIEEEWAIRTKTGISRFLRELYDKFGKGPKFEEYETKLKQDMDAVMYDLKTYLRMHRYE